MQKNTSVTLGDYLEERELSLTILRQYKTVRRVG
jgi:hypothetical protein